MKGRALVSVLLLSAMSISAVNASENQGMDSRLREIGRAHV